MGGFMRVEWQGSDMVDAVVLGIDALDARWVKLWLSQGKMPYLRQLVADSRSTLKEVDSLKAPGHSYPVTHIAWSSIYTGLKPTSHGVTTSPVKMRKHSFAEDIGATLFDDVSAEMGLCSFRMPMTWPARPVNGFMVSGYPAGGRDGNEATEREVYGIEPDDLPSDFHRLEETQMSKSGTENPKSVASLINKDMRGVEVLDELHDDEEVLFFGTQLTDHVGHFFFEKKDEDVEDLPDSEKDFAMSNSARAAYSAVDDLIQHFIDKYDPDYLWAIGDHGFMRHQSNHSMHTALIEYSRNNEPGLSMVDNISEFRAMVTRRLDIDQVSEQYDGQDTDTDVTEEEMEQVTEKLEDLGYM